MKIKVDLRQIMERCVESAVRRASFRCFKYDEKPITEVDFEDRVSDVMLESFFMYFYEIVGDDV